MYIKADKVPESCYYLTAGKVYEIISERSDNGGTITADDGDNVYISILRSTHLGGGAWTRCDANGNPL